LVYQDSYSEQRVAMMNGIEQNRLKNLTLLLFIFFQLGSMCIKYHLNMVYNRHCKKYVM